MCRWSGFWIHPIPSQSILYPTIPTSAIPSQPILYPTIPTFPIPSQPILYLTIPTFPILSHVSLFCFALNPQNALNMCQTEKKVPLYIRIVQGSIRYTEIPGATPAVFHIWVPINLLLLPKKIR